jgi:undecaprenyl-phosphate 4-deoxy-4-formamido-L-arabinose transferase
MIPIQVSIVVPIYRSADTLPLLLERLEADLSPYFDSWEAVLVNDASPDASWETLCSLASRYRFLTAVNLRKNRGQDNALMSGLRIARGEVVVVMDDDLQHDPADVPRLVAKIAEGWDVCFADFRSKKQAFWKNLGSAFNGWVAGRVLGKPSHIYLSPFKALSRGVVDEVLNYQGPYPYLDGLLLTATDSFTQMEIEHHPRASGHGNYNLRRSVGVWLRLATGFSIRPLRIASILGCATASVAFVVGSELVLRRVLGHAEIEGWTSTLATISFLGGLQLMSLGLLGEYVGRTYLTVGMRPQATIREIVRYGEPARARRDP